MKPQAICFDLFETLVSELDITPPSKDEVASALGVPTLDFIRAYRALQRERYTGAIAGYDTVVRHILLQLGAVVNEHAIAQVTGRRAAAFRQVLARIDGEIIDTLTRLRGLGVAVAVVSNTEGSEVGSWSESPLAGLVNTAVFSHEVGITKPDAAIYHEACGRLGVAPESCVFIGDGGSDELRGAAAAGLRPYCAAWFLERHVDTLGADIVAVKSKGFPVLRSSAEVVGLLSDI